MPELLINIYISVYFLYIYMMGDPDVTANLYCNFSVSVLGRLRDLQQMFAVTSRAPRNCNDMI